MSCRQIRGSNVDGSSELAAQYLDRPSVDDCAIWTVREESEFHWRSLAVIAAALVSAMVNGMIVATTAISVFIGPIAADRSWSHAQVGGAVTFVLIGMGVGAPLFGKLVDRFGPRAILLPLTILSGLLLALFSLNLPWLPLFYAGHFCLGLVNPGAIAHSKLISTWFFRRRGIALTAIGTGGAIGQFTIPPIAHWLLGAIGWHQTYLVFAAGELLIAFPVLLLFFRERGGERDVALGGEIHPDGAPPTSLAKALRDKTYWLLAAAQAAGLFAYFGLGTHALGILRERGTSEVTATFGLSLLALGGVIAQVLTGALLDRFDTPRVIAPFVLLSMIGLMILLAGHGDGAVLAAIFLFGVGCGAQTSITSYFTTRYFGVRNFSTIYGSLLPLLLAISAPGPVVIGAVFDQTGSYVYALWVLLAALMMAL